MAAKKKSRKKRNRKQYAQVPFPTVLANVLVLVAVIGLSYMWLCSRCDALGKEIKQKEAELNAANKQLEKVIERWSAITSPPNLRKAIKEHRLDMAMAGGSQTIEVGPWDYTHRTAMIGRQ